MRILSQGGRAVLCLYGYTNQQPDGLSFPSDITEPDITKVAAVTLEVMSLRTELDMLIKVSAVCLIRNNNNNNHIHHFYFYLCAQDTHPHPEFFERIIPSLAQKVFKHVYTHNTYFFFVFLNPTARLDSCF